VTFPGATASRITRVGRIGPGTGAEAAPKVNGTVGDTNSENANSYMQEACKPAHFTEPGELNGMLRGSFLTPGNRFGSS